MKNVRLSSVLPVAVSVLCGILFSAVIIMLWHPYMVSGASMEPTLVHGNYVLSKEAKSVSVGDIVILQNGRDVIIKRLVAIGGDTLCVKDGTLYVNGKPSAWQFDFIQNPGCLKDEITLGADECFVMGDNRERSFDSRMFGPVKRDTIKYVVTKKLF